MKNERKIGNKMVSINDVDQIDVSVLSDEINKVVTIHHTNGENESFNIGYNDEMKKQIISFIHELADNNEINTGMDRLHPMEDKVNSPSHYTGHPSGIECIDITEHYDFCVGNAIKYLWRAGLKKEAGVSDKEKEIEDLKKAAYYIDRKIKQLEK